MTEHQDYTEKIQSILQTIACDYSRLILLVGLGGKVQTAVLRALGERLEKPVINLNLTLSEHLLDVPVLERPIRIMGLLDEIAANQIDDPLLVDHLEILFDLSLKQNPLKILQTLARRRTVIASWNGQVVDDTLHYSTPQHPEFRRYPTRDVGGHLLNMG